MEINNNIWDELFTHFPCRLCQDAKGSNGAKRSRIKSTGKKQSSKETICTVNDNNHNR